MTSCAACYDVIYHPSILKMWGVDRPANESYNGQYNTRTADCGPRTGNKTQTRYKMRTTDYISNSTTHEFKLLIVFIVFILPEILGGGVPPSSPNPKPDQNAIFYTHF